MPFILIWMNVRVFLCLLVLVVGCAPLVAVFVFLCWRDVVWGGLLVWVSCGREVVGGE